MSFGNAAAPIHNFRFTVDFSDDALCDGGGESVPLCHGAFSECSGLEATMEPKVIKEGGRNYGAAQRAGPVTFATVVFKRGMTTDRGLWQWFQLVSQGGYAHRLAATITMLDVAGNGVLQWRLVKAMPTKFKAADLNGKGSEIAIEELHVVHEGLYFSPTSGDLHE